jgi:ribulose-5-phosphate 4-epimerase/fuculose-1-phosphate aldolase
MHFSQIRSSGLVLVNGGEVIEGEHHVNTSAFAIHSRVHAARPDAVAAAHAHSIHGKAWASPGRLLDPITQDSCAFYQNLARSTISPAWSTRLPRATALPKRWELARRLILRNHGLLTVGTSVDEAAWWFIAMERSCQAQLLAESVGRPAMIVHQCALETRNQVAGGINGWFQYQPMGNMISRQEPGLFD